MFALEKFRQIDTFIFDVDGVMTNGQILVTESGEMLRNMNVRDGLALKLAIRAGYHVAIITGGSSLGVEKRLRALGIEAIYLRAHDKWPIFEQHVQQHNLNLESVLYMGDDIPDLRIIETVHVGACPLNAVPEVLQASDYICPLNGGDGCVRDVVEKVMKLKNQWNY